MKSTTFSHKNFNHCKNMKDFLAGKCVTEVLLSYVYLGLSCDWNCHVQQKEPRNFKLMVFYPNGFCHWFEAEIGVNFWISDICLYFIVEESVNDLPRYGPCISNIKMRQYLKFEKNITFDCPVLVCYWLLYILVLGGFRIFMPMRSVVDTSCKLHYVLDL